MARTALETRGGRELLERNAELDLLDAELARAGGPGGGRFVLVGGEAGVGKTALVRAFVDRHPGTRLVWGACDPLFTPRPLGPFADIAATHGGELARLSERVSRPYEVAAALARDLEGGAPALVVLEDMQWADEASLDVVRLLGRRVQMLNALLIATYRDDELHRTHPLRFVLGELPRDESVSRIKLQPLSEGAVAELALTARVDPVELYRKTAGNPFFVTEALASAGAEAIPATVRDAVLARAARLSSGALSLLDMVAVVPQHAELWLLEAVGPEAFASLGECVESGMLARQNGSVGFRHELARLAIEESITPERALTLHRRMLAVLSSPPQGEPDLSRLAHHAEATGDAAAILRYASAAGRRAAAMGAHREAAAELARAARVSSLLKPGERGDLLQDLAQEYLMVNDAQQAIAIQHEAVELYDEAAESLARGDSLRRLSRLYMCGGRGAEAERPIRQAIGILEELPPGRELALAHAGLVMFHMNHDQLEPGMKAAQRAIQLAEELDDQETLLHTLNSLGSMELALGRLSGKEKVLRSLDMAEELGLDEQVGRAYINLAGALVAGRLYDGLLPLLSRGIDFCLEHGLELWRMWLYASQSVLYLETGDWSRAVESAEVVLNAERGDLPRVSALPIIALVRARRGDPGTWPLLDEAKVMADREGELQYAVPVSLARAEAAWLEGRLDAVVLETDATYHKCLAMDAWWALGDIACWRRRAGEDIAVDPRMPERYRAELAGEWEKAAALWSALGCEYRAALALAGAETEDPLRQSLVKLQRLGARTSAAVIARKLRELGASRIARGPRASTRSNPGQLTGRELEVLGLVSAGLRNAEIATRLFLTPKTVDHHVSAILRKLDVRSRADATRAASRLGLFS